MVLEVVSRQFRGFPTVRFVAAVTILCVSNGCIVGDFMYAVSAETNATIVDSGTQTPIPNARLSFSPSSSNPPYDEIGTSDAEGRITGDFFYGWCRRQLVFIPIPRSEKVTLRLSADGYETKEWTYNISELDRENDRDVMRLGQIQMDAVDSN